MIQPTPSVGRPEPPQGAARVRLVLLLGLLAAFGPLSLDMYLAGLPELARDLDVDVSAAQLTLTACLAGLALGQLVAGPVSDAVGRRRPLLVGLALYVVASAVCAVSPTIEAAVVARLVQGLAGAAGIVIARAIVRDLYDGAEAARFFSLLMLVHGAAPILAPIVGGQVLTVTSWRGIFALLAAVGLALLLAVAGMLRETLPPPGRRGGGVRTTVGTVRGLLTDARFLGYAVSCGLAFGAMFAYIGNAPFVLQELYGLSPQAFSLLFAANAAGFVLTGQVNGRLVGRIGPQRLLVVGLVAEAIGALILLAVTLAGTGVIAVAAALFLVVSPLGFVLPNAAALALAGRPSVAGSASALLGAFQFLIGAVSAPVAGLGGIGPDITMATVIVVLSTAAPLSLALLARAARQRAPAAEPGTGHGSGRETQHPFRRGQDIPDGLEEDRGRACEEQSSHRTDPGRREPTGREFSRRPPDDSGSSPFPTGVRSGRPPARPQNIEREECSVAAKPFASSADLGEKEELLEVLGDGVYALTAGGDPNVGAVEGEDFVVAFEARATPVMAQQWLDKLREQTDKPVKYLVLSHYHAVRVLGAAAFNAEVVIAHETTRKLIAERGKEDWDSEAGRMPRLFKGAETIPGLTWPDVTFTDRLSIDLGGDRGELVLQFCGRGHTAGDLVAWVPSQKVLFAGDLVEAEAALYTGDAYHREWSTGTLDAVKAFQAEALVGGRGGVPRGREQVDAAIEQTRHFVRTLLDSVEGVHRRGGSVKEAFQEADAALGPQFGHWPIYQHCMPFDVSRVWDELDGVDPPRVWTAQRDREVWDQLQS